MAITTTNETYGVVTSVSSDWTTAVNVVTVPAGGNLYLSTVKMVDMGGDGGEIRLLLYDGTNTYCMDAISIEGNDNLDLSPLETYKIKAGWSVQYQSKGGADIHITMTGVMVTVS